MALVLTLLAGCAASTAPGVETATGLAFARGLPATPEPETDSLLAAPVTAGSAVRLAWANSPLVAQRLATFGLDRAALAEARRPGNPELDLERLATRGGPGHKLTFGLSAPVGELLLLPARRRMGEAAYTRATYLLAHDLLALATATEDAYWQAAAAASEAAVAAAVADAADLSAALAGRHVAAGTLPEAALASWRITAFEAGAEARTARIAADRARATLAIRMGLPVEADWRLETRLPLPVASGPSVAKAQARMVAQRLDLRAARIAVDLAERGERLARGWAWLGDVELGFARERESGVRAQAGPTLRLRLPLFDQGQSSVTRARAEALQARALLDQMELEAGHDVARAIAALDAAGEAVVTHEGPARASQALALDDARRRYAFMLTGVFELLDQRIAAYRAEGERIAALRDYWLARLALKRITGGALPDDDAVGPPQVGFDWSPSPASGSDSAAQSHTHHGH